MSISKVLLDADRLASFTNFSFNYCEMNLTRKDPKSNLFIMHADILDNLHTSCPPAPPPVPVRNRSELIGVTFLHDHIYQTERVRPPVLHHLQLFNFLLQRFNCQTPNLTTTQLNIT